DPHDPRHRLRHADPAAVKRWQPHPMRTLLANASLRVRVMAVAAILVTVTSAVMGLLGTTLLRGYLMDRIDTQLSNFDSAVTRILAHPPPPQARPHPNRPQLPPSFLLEVIDADGQMHTTPGSMHGIAPPRLSAAQLHGSSIPFTAPAAGDPGHSW